MGNMSKDNNQVGMEMSAQGYQLVFNGRRGNPHTTGQVAAASKTTLYTGTATELPKLWCRVKQNKRKLKVKTKQDIQRPDKRKTCGGV